MSDERPRNPFYINEHALDEEWIRQPQLMRRAGIDEAEARHVHTQAKARLAVVEARLKLRIKRSPELFDLPEGKPTIPDIEAVMLANDEYQAASKEVDEAKFAMDLASANTVALIDRRKALERLVELLALNYYSERGEPRPRSEQGREQIELQRRRAVRGSPDDD